MAGIRIKKSDEPSTPPASRVELWFDELNDSWRYKKDTGQTLNLISDISITPEIQRIVSEYLANHQATRFTRDTFIITPTDIENGYLILTEKAITGSINASVDRLVIIEGIDFSSVNTENNQTMINFSQLTFPAKSSDEEISAGAVVSIHYAF